MKWTKSVFLANLHYAYAQTDGTYKFPNNMEGDMLKQAKREIEQMRLKIKRPSNPALDTDLGRTGEIPRRSA